MYWCCLIFSATVNILCKHPLDYWWPQQKFINENYAEDKIKIPIINWLSITMNWNQYYLQIANFTVALFRILFRGVIKRMNWFANVCLKNGPFNHIINFSRQDMALFCLQKYIYIYFYFYLFEWRRKK